MGNLIDLILDIWRKTWPPLLAVVITQWINWLRLPRLKIEIDSPEGEEVLWDLLKFRSYRFKVCNKKISFPLRFLPREVANNCTAKLEFHNLNGERLFIMKGRWANRVQIPHMIAGSQIERTLFPDPIDILSGKEEILDCFVRFKDDVDAYGWNNEAYSHNGKTPHYKLSPARYKIIVVVTPLNGKPARKDFSVTIEPKRVIFSNYKVNSNMSNSVKLIFVGFSLYFLPKLYIYLAQKWFEADKNTKFWFERSKILRKRF